MPTLRYQTSKTKAFKLKKDNVIIEISLNKIKFLQNKEYVFDFNVIAHGETSSFIGYYIEDNFNPDELWIKINNLEPLPQIAKATWYLFKLRYKVTEFFEQQVNRATNIINKGKELI